MKNESQMPLESAQLEESIPSFLDVESRVFAIGQDKKTLWIGKDKVEPTLRSLLRDEAKNLQGTRLWEILNASIINESYNLALIQSKDFDEVRFAKALKHWSFFMMNVLAILSKE